MTVPLSSADPVRLGDYEILARLGSGGQGVVYLGRPLAGPGQGELGARGQVAIKLLHAQMVASRDARARFVRELSLLQRVAGFCTAQVIEADLAGDQPYIVSEYVPGPSLRELVHGQGPRAGADLDRLAISSVTALTAIHRTGIVHRDFKPQNVLMGADGPRVIDFGIARALDPEATVTSQIVGTPAYMAPEQFAGAEIGPAADLFAWAATMLFAATGRDPFAGGPLPAVMYRIMHHTPDLAVLPEQIAAVAADALQKDPTARPSAEGALLRLLGDRTSPNRPPPTQIVPPDRATSPQTGGAGEQASAHPHATGDTHRAPRPPEPGPVSAGHTTADRPEAPPAWATEPVPPPPGPRAWDETSPSTWGQPQQPTHPGYGGRPVPPPPVASNGAPIQGSAYPNGANAYAPRPAERRTLKRGPALITGLLLAAALAALDVLSLAIFVARPELTSGTGGRWLLVVASSFVLLAIVTLVGVALAWRGGRAATWTVMGARVARVPLWGALTAVPDVDVPVQGITGYAALTALVVALLAQALRRR